MNEMNGREEMSVIIPDVPSAYFLDTDPFDSLYISQRYILLAIEKFLKGEDVIITVYDNKETRDIFTNYRSIFGEQINTLKIIWVPSDYYKTVEFLTGENINWKEFLASHGRDISTKSMGIPLSVKRCICEAQRKSIEVLHMRGYKVTTEMLALGEKIREKSMDVVISGESDTKKDFLHTGKAILHPNLSGERVIDLGDDILENIPHGVVVSEKQGKQGLKNAVKKILDQDSSIKKVLIKPLNASSGEGITFVDVAHPEDVIDTYNFGYGDVVVEECINLMLLSDLGVEGYGNDPMSLSIQYYDGKIAGKPVVQLTKDNEFQGNILLSDADITQLGLPEELFQQVVKYSEKLIERLSLEGNGGFDFLFDRDGKFYFIDPNLGRDTGALPVRLFERIFLNKSGERTTIFSKIDASNVFDLGMLIQAFKIEGIQTISSENIQGVLPVSFVAGQHLTLIISGRSYEQVDTLLNHIKNMVLSRNFGEKQNTGRIICSAGDRNEYNTYHKS